MAENEQHTLLLQSSPHIARHDTTSRIMVRVIIALLPVSVFGVVTFGINALLNIAVSIASAVIAQALFRRATNQELKLDDCSAVVTGLLLALVLPPTTPLWMTVLGAVFAIVVAKEFFGGLGANVFNPALVGRAFLLMSFPAPLTTWLKPAAAPFAPDGSTGATPLAVMRTAAQSQLSADGGTQASAMYVPIEKIFGMTGPEDLYKELFFGFRGGSTGETSILLILAGALYLLVTKTIDWRAPVAMLLSAMIAGIIAGVDPVFTLFSGGLMFGAVFMATDYTSTPVTSAGKLIFGAGAGIIVILIRKFGAYPEGVMFAILIMNAVTPYLNRFMHKKYGHIKLKKTAGGNTK